MSIASAEQKRRLGSVASTITAAALLVLLAHAPCVALCGDGVSPQFVLNTLGVDGHDRVTVLVKDAFNRRPIRGAEARILSAPDGLECVAEGPVPVGGIFEAYVPAGTFFAEITQGGYRTGFSESFVCPGTGAWIPVPAVELQTKTVVLVHGWISDDSVWSNAETTAWKDTLEMHGYCVLTPEMPGSVEFGLAGTQSIPDQAAMLANVIESFGVESVYIVAHSFGGLTSRWCSERLLEGRVVRLVTLATPHHGSPLAIAPVGIGVLLALGEFTAPSWWWLLPPSEFVELFLQTFGAAFDMMPDSANLRLLNQGDRNSTDWGGVCGLTPADEVLSEGSEQYCTVTATERSPGLYTIGGRILGLNWSCWTSDGIVPHYSAALWADGDDLNDDRVRNYLAATIGEDSHHLGRPDAVSIVDNTDVRDFVIGLLENDDLPSGHWIPPDLGEPGTPCTSGRAGGFVSLPLIDGEIEGETALVESLAVEPTDSLSVMFTWFSGNVFLSLEDPLEALVDTSTAFIDRESKTIIYSVGSPEPGVWKLHVESQPGTPAQRYVIIPNVMSDTTCDLEVAPSAARPGQELTVRASVASAGSGIPGAAVTAKLLAPSGVEDELILYDDGMHGDGAADDGVYGAGYVAAEEGPYVATADMTLSPGRDQARDAISRQAWFTFAAVESLDLAIVDGSTQVLETTQFVDMPCHIRTEVTNSGAAACDSVRVVFDLEGAANPLADTLLVLAPGQTELLEVPLTPAAACTHVVHVRVRAADGRADENTGNDEGTITFLPEVGIPNLTIGSVTLSNPNPAPGEEITAEIVILSNNTARSTGTFVDVYYDLDEPPVVDQRGDEEIYIQPLMPGESFALTSQPFSYGSDDYFGLYFQVDPENLCAEADESDNVYSTSVVTSVDDSGTAFAVSAANGRALLQWMAPALDGVTGFNVCRSISQAGPFNPVNSDPIPLCSMCEYEDVTAWPGREFWYELRGILPGGGEIVLAGPVSIQIDGTLAFGLAASRPNPSSQETWFALDLPRDCAEARLEIYDVSGRLVRVVTDGPATRGRHSIRWDLADSFGHPVAAGVYFARASAGEWTGTRKVVVIR